MKDLSLHLLDILENSAKAGATRVEVTLTPAGTWLTLDVSDNGPGLAPEIGGDPSDPFRTTRQDRNVGLGLALLRAAAEQTAGRFEIRNGSHGGVRLHAAVNLAHIDAKPLGDLPAAFTAAVLAWPDLDLVVRLGPEGRDMLNTVEVKEELDGVSLAHPVLQRFLHKQLEEAVQELAAWAGQVMAAHGE